MSPSRIGLLLAALLAALLSALAAGCDRLAGTEVGNPELTVTARFALRDSDATASVPEMKLKLMGMGWKHGSDSDSCWTNPEGKMVDFTRDDASQLAAVKVPGGTWSNAYMWFQAGIGDSIAPAIASYGSWSNPRYAKIITVMGGDTLRFLFEMPKDLRLKLLFGKSTIDSWHKGDSMTVDVYLDVGKWSAGLGSDPAFRLRTDGEHLRYVLLSPVENAAAYQTMRILLPHAFMADSSAMQ